MPTDLKVLMNHIYEFRKGVRKMVLFTFNDMYRDCVVSRMEDMGMAYLLQPVGNGRSNLYFGRPECIAAVRVMVNRPLNLLSPEEDFILGALLGYDICAQCERYCERKCRSCSCSQ